ncbi:hypothetical protein PV10_06984 [Exophiala mesophila]|uniref:RING-type domain-containing protein n=1 Tax=Exophiala mesophila TaxID=212818 RepID=A0A0D1ZS54_EXOME|nr:uncharacterized protein PV10_06984 [Exophiala mesophila]KIV89598.1 hypothetical protein PV10_06984 [Exophiala mesophila]
MGNNSSVPRAQPDDGQLEELTHQNTDTLSADPDVGSRGRTSRLARRNTQSLRAVGQRASIFYDTFRRQRPHDTSNVGILDPQAPLRPSADTEFEQENRPLVGSQLPDSNISLTVTPQTTSRRRSTISRLALRVLPEPIGRLRGSPLGSDTVEENTLHHPADSVLSLRSTQYPGHHNISTSRLSLMAQDSRQEDLDIPNDDLAAFQRSYQHPSDPSASEPSSFDGMREVSNQTSFPLRSRNRFGRARASISLSSRISSLLGRTSEQFQSSQNSRDSTTRTTRVAFADDSDRLLSPSEHRRDPDDQPHELDAVEAETRTGLSNPRVTSGMSTIRRFQPGLRSRSTRLIRRGEHPPLSQVLQLAAAAIAAQLSGHGPGPHAGTRAPGSETFDGSIQNFVQTLQDAATAQAGENIDISSTDGDLPPVNFMRVFQFPNDENGSPIASQAQSRDVGQADLDNITGPDETDRSVTLVLVGVRSLPHGQDASNGENGSLGPSLDTLLSLPFLPPANVLRNGSSGALFRRSDAGARRSHARRHSMTNYSFPSQYDSQRHQRTRNSVGRSSSSADPSALTASESNPTTSHVSESPPGPNPPPSTPADIRSGQVSPARRPSSASAANRPQLHEAEEGHYQAREPAMPDTSFNAARQRRRSDSEFARRPELGSGAARRNGMVEPDHPPAGVGRSWLIYVVGTNVSPDHPAFTMPSLFTDNPSYEDMQMLSTLLGPVKPPVASEDDVNASGGLFLLEDRDGVLMGQEISGVQGETLTIGVGERCLICLSEFVVAEEIRRLAKCSHSYHRECIDEWLTTGRNSCPMCRGQGVQEQSAQTTQATRGN